MPGLCGLSNHCRERRFSGFILRGRLVIWVSLGGRVRRLVRSARVVNRPALLFKGADFGHRDASGRKARTEDYPMQIVEAFNRIGEENAFAVLARATDLAAQGRDIINLGIGQPDFPTPPHIVEAAIKALRDGHHGYTAANGIVPLREAVAADLHKRFNVEVSPDEVMIMP